MNSECRLFGSSLILIAPARQDSGTTVRDYGYRPSPSRAYRADMSSRPVDLEDRLVGFAATVCKLAERFPRSLSGRHVAQQLIRSATSPFANYGEARAAQSRRDFIHKMRVCLKELRESMTWLKFTDRVGLTVAPGLSTAIDECDQLIAIFVTSIRTAEAGDGRRGTDPR